MTEYTPDALYEQYVQRRQNGPRPLTNYSRTHREAYAAGIRDLLDLLTSGEWERITEADAIAELRNPKSLFRPLFHEDPTIWADCPDHGRVAVGPEGYCDQCGHEFI